MADMLRGHGYKTHAIGKWHLGFHSVNHTPVFRGFDSFLGMYLGSASYYNHDNMGAYDFRYNIKRADGTLSDTVLEAYKGIYSTEIYTNRTLDILSRHTEAYGDSRPLFVYLAYQTPHGPFEAPPQQYMKQAVKSGKKARRTYSGMVSAMDYGVGEIVGRLEELEMLDNTLLVFTSDNGGVMGEYACNFPLR